MIRGTIVVSAVATLVTATGCSYFSGSVSLTVDGKKQDISGGVDCSSHAAGTVIAVGGPPSGVRVDVAPAHSGISDADLGNSTGTPLIAKSGSKLVWSDKDYDITGEAVPKDGPASAAAKSFELKVSCP